MKKFEMPEIEILKLSVEDVMAASGDEGREDEFPLA